MLNEIKQLSISVFDIDTRKTIAVFDIPFPKHPKVIRGHHITLTLVQRCGIFHAKNGMSRLKNYNLLIRYPRASLWNSTLGVG